ncbi:hypothetical protein SH139x_003817 [Planctomycetaceae bacterium SH139]
MNLSNRRFQQASGKGPRSLPQGLFFPGLLPLPPHAAHSSRHSLQLGLWLMLGLLIVGGPLAGLFPGSLSAAQAQGSAEIIAYAGEPFGVAQIRYAVPRGEKSETPLPVRVEDTEGRTHYPSLRQLTQVGRSGPPLEAIPPGPVIGQGRLLGRMKNIIRTITSEEIEETVGHEVSFLFRGDTPFRVIVSDGTRREFVIRPLPPRPASGAVINDAIDRIRDGQPQRTLLEAWWQSYTQSASYGIEAGDYPPLVESYLLATLSRRLNLPLPPAFDANDEEDAAIDASAGGAVSTSSEQSEENIASTLELLAGTEAMRAETFRRVARGDTEQFSEANLEAPAAPEWLEHRDWEMLERELNATGVSADQPQAIEPLASRVPKGSFYLRFGSFKNYLWFRDLSSRYGGDISRMITIRGFDYQAASRTEKLLDLSTTELAITLGPTVIDDMALIGYDLFLTEGPAIGTLLKAKNAFLLGTSLNGQRAATAARLESATLQTLELDGSKVTLLSTPDNQIRSYLVNEGEYFLISSSETLVRAFIACGRGGENLADSRGFQYARRLLPASNDYTIFAYFSADFFQNLAGPQYQIELRRRLYATADISLTRLATLAARGEGRNLNQLDQLTAAGYLPDGIGRRPDGSGPIIAGDTIIDSRRGRLGSFKPVADVPIGQVTEEEYRWYSRRAEFYSEEWQQMDPLVVGVRPTSRTADGIERVEIHAEIAPLVPEKYGWLAEQLGPPTKVALQFAPDDIAAIQAHVVSDQLGGSIPPHHLFLAVKDELLPNPAELDGLLDKFRALKSLAGYIGAWPQPGLLDRLPLGLGRGRPIGPGMTRLLGGLYRYQANGFSIVSFLPEIITNSVPYLAIVEAEQPAQVRLHVDNLQGTRLEAWINNQLYLRSHRASIAGARLLDTLTSQLRVPAAEAAKVTSVLLDADLQCPLGGSYRLAATPVGPRWSSSAVNGTEAVEVPVGYLAPVLSWFRGTSGRLTQYDQRLVADLLIDMATDQAPRPPAPRRGSL